jgi:hypothetical protein
VPIPWYRFIDLHKLLHKYCCKRRKWYSDYEKEMTNVNAEINRNLEITSFLRRLTAYGYAFKFLMDETVTNVIAERTEKILLRDKSLAAKMTPIEKKFGIYTLKDRWLIAIFRKFMDSW